MDPRGSAIIDFTEAAYDLETPAHDWLPSLLRAGAPAIDHGLGVVALICRRPAKPGPLVVNGVDVHGAPDDFLQRLLRLQSSIGPEALWPLSRPGMPKTLSEVAEDHDSDAFKLIMSHFDFARDGLGISAFDPDGYGIYLIAPLPKVTSLSVKARERWQMLAAHFDAGYRLRRALSDASASHDEGGSLPYGAEAIIDPTDFKVADATGPARSPAALDALREAALQVDRARGDMRESDPTRALELWKALVRGRWSTVDWFDTDGRRFVLGIPNAPGVSDPRGLSPRETQVVAYAISGLTNKLIGYHLGISKGRVSTVLNTAMRKLGVASRAELVWKLRGFGSLADERSPGG